TDNWPENPVGVVHYNPKKYHELRRIARGILKSRRRSEKYHRLATSSNAGFWIELEPNTLERLATEYGTSPPRGPAGAGPIASRPAQRRSKPPDPDLFGLAAVPRSRRNGLVL